MQLPEHIKGALRDYDRRRDRATPPVFVGRADELRFLRETVAAAKGGAEGVTAIVQGVPGAGKSALCRRFEQEAEAAIAEAAPTVVVPKPVGFFDRTPASMVKELAAEVPVRGSAVDLAMQAMNLDESSTLGSALDTFAERMWPDGMTLILTVDEMQRIEDTPQLRSNLGEIHDKRFDTNIAVLGFGLQNTAARLRALGLSRLGTGQVRHLGTMSSDDAASLVDETFDHLGLKASDPDWRTYAAAQGLDGDDWNAWRTAAKAVILEESAAFPHHLVNGIRGVCRSVLGGELGQLAEGAEAQLGRIRQSCADSKADYYAARLEDAIDHTAALAAALRCADAAGEVERALVLRALETSDNSARRVDEETALGILNGLIERGLLARRGMANVAVEIPSLASYLENEFDRSLASGGSAAVRLAAAFGNE